jgi:predicted phage terminase large subunit-like protein
MRNKTYVIGHVVRGRWGALEREEQIKAWAQIDRDAWGWGYEIYVEQEPGSGGKESAEATIRELRGFRVFGDRVTGSKEVRAEPFAAQVQGGNVRLLAGPWQGDLLAELEAFPNGKYKDQVDACSGAFAKLTGDGYYNIDALAS